MVLILSQSGKVCKQPMNHLNVKTGTLSKGRELYITFDIVLIKELLTTKFFLLTVKFLTL